MIKKIMFILIFVFVLSYTSLWYFLNYHVSVSSADPRFAHVGKYYFFELKRTDFLLRPVCSIQWFVRARMVNGLTVSEPRTRSLEVHVAKCTINFDEQIKMHKTVLSKINQKWLLKDSVSYIMWWRFCARHTQDWCRKIILDSIGNSTLKAFRREHPLSGWGSSKAFLEIAEKTSQYKKLKNMFGQFGLKIEKIDVEKVEQARLNKVTQRYQIKNIASYKNPKGEYPWVVFGGQTIGFEVKSLRSN